MSLRENLQFKDWSYRPTSTPAQRRNAFGLNLVFAFVGVTFASALLAYAFARFSLGAPRGSAVPPAFWASTACGLAGGWCLRHGVRAVRRERQRRFRGLLVAAGVLGVGFAVCQFVGFLQIAGRHEVVTRSLIGDDRGTDPGSALNGVLAAIVLLHAAHFLGGLIVLFVTVGRALRGRYDHEYYFGVVLAARYWTFLDVVWVVMLACFAITG